MKGLKKIACLLLAMLMILSMAACNPTNPTEKETEKQTEKATEKTDETEAPTEYQFPEGAEISIWMEGINYDPQVGISTRSEMLCWQTIEEMFGVKLNFIEPAYGTKADALSILLASNELPDLFYTKKADFDAHGGLDSLIEQGAILDFGEYIDEYMPNYASYLYQDGTFKSDDLQRATMTATGKIGMISPIMKTEQGPWLGYVVRQDWLDELGLEQPVTYDDWHEVLTAFKEQKGATGALWLNARGSDQVGIFGAGYDITGLGSTVANAFFQKDGKVYYSCLEEGYKNYIAMLAQWYSEGLIDPDFYTSTLIRCEKDMSLIASGKVGACASSINYFPNYATTTGVEGMNFQPVTYPVLEEGQTTHVRIVNTIICDEGWVISADCENVEMVCRWIDALWTQEAIDVLNFGKEGVTYEIVNGEAQFNDMVMNNPDGLTKYQARTKYASTAGMVYDWMRDGFTEEVLNTQNHLWLDTNDGAYVIVNKSLTSEEGDEWSSIMADVDTAAVEWTVKFITGQKSVEDDWDEFISIIKSMGIERAIEIYQAGVDRYMTLPVK